MPGIPATAVEPGTETVGRHGTLLLEYARRGARTVLARSSSRSPWHVFPPSELDDGACAYSLLVNPSGGLVGGDQLSVQVSVEPGAHALISTPSANRVYRSTGAVAEQTIELHIAEGGVLEWLPDPTIPFAGSRFRQTITVRLASDAALILWDVLAAGRIACDERWLFDAVANEIRIAQGRGEVIERYTLGRENGAARLTEAWNYVASIYVVSDRLDPAMRARLSDRIAEIIEAERSVLGGVSEPAMRGIVVKVLAKGATELREVLESVWGAARAELVCRSAPALRRY